MNSFIGEELNIGDRVVYLKNTMTGSSTKKKCKYVGEILGFTKEKVKLMQVSYADRFEADKFYGETSVFPEDVVCKLENSKN